MTQMLRFTRPEFAGYLLARRPVSDPPEDGTICFVDAAAADDITHRPVIAMYRDGAWTNGVGTPLPFAPTFWSTIKSKTDGE